MCRLQNHIWTKNQIDFGPVQINFNQTTVLSLTELGPAQPRFFFHFVVFVFILAFHVAPASILYI